MSRKNPRFRLCKVQTIIPNSSIIDLEQDHHLEHCHVVKTLRDSIFDNRKNDDDNTALIQKDILSSTSRLENIIEKVLYVSCISILLNVIILCIC